MRLSVLLSLEQCEILLFYTLWRHLHGRRVAYKIVIWTAKLFAEQREVPLFFPDTRISLTHRVGPVEKSRLIWSLLKHRLVTYRHGHVAIASTRANLTHVGF